MSSGDDDRFVFALLSTVTFAAEVLLSVFFFDMVLLELNPLKCFAFLSKLTLYSGNEIVKKNN